MFSGNHFAESCLIVWSLGYFAAELWLESKHAINMMCFFSKK